MVQCRTRFECRCYRTFRERKTDSIADAIPVILHLLPQVRLFLQSSLVRQGSICRRRLAPEIAPPPLPPHSSRRFGISSCGIPGPDNKNTLINLKEDCTLNGKLCRTILSAKNGAQRSWRRRLSSFQQGSYITVAVPCSLLSSDLSLS